MIIIDSIDQAVGYLKQGCQIAKVHMDYSGMEREHLVAGILLGLSMEKWWYVLLSESGCRVCGLVEKETFVSLYRMYYIEPTVQGSEIESCYTLNTVCTTQEMSRYMRRIESWKETISSPNSAIKLFYE